MRTEFFCNAEPLMSMYQNALDGLRANIRPVLGQKEPVLNEGGMYDGVWLEAGPICGTILGEYDPQAALNLHTIFIRHQDEEGFIPPAVSSREVKTGHLQTVVPFARTALMCVKRFGLTELLLPAYEASAKYDAWLTKYRNRLGTGLVEAACYWDTGHDHSGRHLGQPDHFPDFDTKKYPDCPFFLAADLSATKYGGRLAMAEMADLLGKPGEAAHWREKAEELRQAILQYTFDDEDCMFYDRWEDGTFNRIKCDVLTRVMQEHVPSQELFEQLFERHILNPKEFWTPYPLPSVAADDPRFDSSFPPNNWSGASQIHTAMRVPLWMEYYGKLRTQRVLMEKWVEAIVRSGEFMQQMNPFSGSFNTTSSYSPAMCVLVDFIGRLYGVKLCEDGTLLWGCTKAAGATFSRFETQIGQNNYVIVNENNHAVLSVNHQPVLTVYGDARIRTDMLGKLLSVYETGEGRVLTE